MHRDDFMQELGNCNTEGCSVSAGGIFGRRLPYVDWAASATPSRKAALRGFTLVELLVVMGIIVLLMSLSTNALKSVVLGDPLQRSLIGISSAMELARQTAVASGTYTWVALGENKDSMGNNQIVVLVFASKDGNLDSDSGGRKNFKLLDRIQFYQNVQISEDNPPDNVAQQLPDQFSVSGSLKDSEFKPAVEDVAPGNATQGLVLDWAIMFTPSGEAAIDSPRFKSATQIPMQRSMSLGVLPAKNATPTNTERKRFAVLWVDGLTGAVTVFQPQA